jgi:hypothetical protein
MLPIYKPQTDIDTIRLSIPLFIRLLEFAREDAKTDMDLHFITESVTEGSKQGILGMTAYNDIIEHLEKQRKVS